MQQNPTLDGQKVVPWSSSTSPSLQVCCSKPKNLVEPSGIWSSLRPRLVNRPRAAAALSMASPPPSSPERRPLSSERLRSELVTAAAAVPGQPPVSPVARGSRPPSSSGRKTPPSLPAYTRNAFFAKKPRVTSAAHVLCTDRSRVCEKFATRRCIDCERYVSPAHYCDACFQLKHVRC